MIPMALFYWYYFSPMKPGPVSIVMVADGGVVQVKAGSTPETLAITKRLTLKAVGGEVAIGE